MKFRMLASLGIALVVTVLVTASAKAAYDGGAELLARFLMWPNTVLQSLIPCFNIGTAKEPFCEGTPLHLFVFVASELLSVAVYALIAYALIRRHKLMRT